MTMTNDVRIQAFCEHEHWVLSEMAFMTAKSVSVAFDAICKC